MVRGEGFQHLHSSVEYVLFLVDFITVMQKYALERHSSLRHAELARGADEEADEEALK